MKLLGTRELTSGTQITRDLWLNKKIGYTI